MNVWGWHSPIAWAIFLVGCGVTAFLLSWAIKTLSEAGMIGASIATIDQKKK